MVTALDIIGTSIKRNNKICFIILISFSSCSSKKLEVEWVINTKKNVSNLLRLRYLRYRQTPVLPKRVKAHALGREPSTLLLQRLLKFGEFQITRFSGRFNVYSFSLSLLCYHKRFVFRVRHYYLSDCNSPMNSLSFKTKIFGKEMSFRTS